MILGSMMSFLPALLLAGEAPAAPAVSFMRVEEQLVIRVPVQPRPRARIRWQERRGFKCLAARGVRGAMLSGQDSIDFVMRRGARLRARLDSSCEGLDFYGGFYVQTEDNRICAGRDFIRSRMGATCRIERLRLLVPKVDE